MRARERERGVGGGGRERDRQTDRQTDRDGQGHTHTHTQRQRQTDRQTERQGQRQKDRKRQRQRSFVVVLVSFNDQPQALKAPKPPKALFRNCQHILLGLSLRAENHQAFCAPPSIGQRKGQAWTTFNVPKKCMWLDKRIHGHGVFFFFVFLFLLVFFFVPGLFPPAAAPYHHQQTELWYAYLFETLLHSMHFEATILRR